MHLNPENAPVGAVVVIRLRGHVKLVEISEWNGEKVGIRWEGEFFGAEVGFISRLDRLEQVKQPSPDRLDAWPTVEDVTSGRVAGEWAYRTPHAHVGEFKLEGDSVVFCSNRSTWTQEWFERNPGCYFTRVGSSTTAPGDSVTIERDRAAMDALKRLADRVIEGAGGQSGLAVDDLERIVGHDIAMRERVCVIVGRYGYQPGDSIEDWLDSELSALRDLRRASERLPGEGDVVGWKSLPADFGQGDTANSSGYSRGFGWCMLSNGARVSEFFQPPHPDLYPVRVDGVWRWVRKEKV